MFIRMTRAAFAATLLLVLAACSQPTALPTLSKRAGDTPALSSFVALADALDIDLDAATATGLLTVFAPSNALLDKYAVHIGLADAAELLAEIEDADEAVKQALREFVAAHIAVHMPGLLTKEFLTEQIADELWFWYSISESLFDTDNGRLTAIVNDPETATLQLGFLGASSPIDLGVGVSELVFLAADVPFRSGIVHVIDGDVGDFFFF